MSNQNSSQENFESLQFGFEVITELDERIDDEDAQAALGAARAHIATACRNAENPGFDREFPKAMGMASSLAISYGYDDLAEQAIKIGGKGVQSRDV